MRSQVSFTAFLAAAAALLLCVGVHAQAPAPSQPPADSSSSSSAPVPQAQAEPNGTYIAIDPLANIRYDNRYDVSVGMAYDHLKAGPNLLQGSNLGGLDLTASYWLSKHWAVEGTGRGYLGTSGAAPNSVHINGPFVAQYILPRAPSGWDRTTNTAR